MAHTKRLSVSLSAGVLTALFLTALVYAQMTAICSFKGTNIPLSLKVQEKILAKGAYDVEFLRTSSPVLYYIKFMKRGKVLGVVQGEEWPYAGGIVSDIPKDKTIPKPPTMKMTINRTDKVLTFVLESGRNALLYPMVRARFRLPYEE